MAAQEKPERSAFMYLAESARRIDDFFAGNRFRGVVYSSIAAVYAPIILNIFSDRSAVLYGGHVFTAADYLSILFTCFSFTLVASFIFSAISPSPHDDDEDTRPFGQKLLSFLRIIKSVSLSSWSSINKYSKAERDYLAAALLISAAMISLLLEQASHWVRILWWLAFHSNPHYATVLQNLSSSASMLLLVSGFFFLWRVRNAGTEIRRPVIWVQRDAPSHTGTNLTSTTALSTFGPIVVASELKGHPQRDSIDRVMALLSEWNPGQQWYEKDYEQHLRLSLITKMPTHSIKSQVRLERGRPDIIIDDSILIELKAKFSKGATDRAKGQVGGYLESWQNRGPVLLLLCGQVDETVPLAFESWIKEQRQLGKPLTLVVAGTIPK